MVQLSKIFARLIASQWSLDADFIAFRFKQFLANICLLIPEFKQGAGLFRTLIPRFGAGLRSTQLTETLFQFCHASSTSPKSQLIPDHWELFRSGRKEFASKFLTFQVSTCLGVHM